MNEYTFSIIIPVYNVEDYISEALDSIINQSFDFKSIQIILIDDGSTDRSYDICSEYHQKYPDNIILLKQENKGSASARNNGLQYVKGKYVNFLDSDDKLSPNALEEACNFFNSHDNIDFLSIPIIMFGAEKGNHTLNYKFDGTDRVVNVLDNYEAIQLSMSASFFKWDVLKEYRFNENLVRAEDALIINRMLIKNPSYGLVNNAQYFYRRHFSNDSLTNRAKYKKGFFNDFLKEYCIELIDLSKEQYGEVPKFIQYLLAYDLKAIVQIPDFPKDFTKDEREEFWNLLTYIMNFIDDDIINNHSKLPNRHLKLFYKYLKSRDFNIVTRKKHNEVFLKAGKYLISKMHLLSIWMDYVNIEDDCLVFSGSFSSNCDNRAISIQAVKKVFKFKSSKSETSITKSSKSQASAREVYDAIYMEYPTTQRSNLKYLGIDWKFVYNFILKVPIKADESFKLSFRILYDENFEGSNIKSIDADLGQVNTVYMNPNINFRGFANLSKESNYKASNDHILLFKDNSFHLVPFSSKFMLRLEKDSILKLLREKPSDYLYSIFIRLIYLISFSRYNKKSIILFSDNERYGYLDDNSINLFKYAMEMNDNDKKYLAVKDWKALLADDKLKKHSKNIIQHGSLKHKILYLFADKLLTSYLRENYFNPFYDKNPTLYSGLNSSKRYYLPNEISLSDNSSLINDYKSNLSFYLTASDIENEDLISDHYNFGAKWKNNRNDSILDENNTLSKNDIINENNTVLSLGFPRYDNYNDKINENTKTAKQILFIPAWRNYIKDEDSLINSDYFNRINGLLSSSNLKSFLDESNLMLVFKPDYNLKEYACLFNIDNDRIQISDKPYRELFEESDMLVTDFADISFDFALFKRPIIYYQSDEDRQYLLDNNYNPFFDFNEMAFGEVLDNEYELIDKLSHYQSSPMEDTYKERVDSFFKHIDKDNSKRVYDWIKLN